MARKSLFNPLSELTFIWFATDMNQVKSTFVCRQEDTQFSIGWIKRPETAVSRLQVIVFLCLHCANGIYQASERHFHSRHEARLLPQSPSLSWNLIELQLWMKLQKTYYGSLYWSSTYWAAISQKWSPASICFRGVEALWRRVTQMCSHWEEPAAAMNKKDCI